MFNFFNRIKRTDIKTMRNIVLICLCTVLILGLLSISYYYKRSYNILENQMLESLKQNAEQVGLNVSYRLQNVDEISLFLLQNIELYEILNRSGMDDGIAQQLKDFQRLKEITEVVYGGDNIFALRIFLSGDKIYSREGMSFFDIDTISETALGEVIEVKNGLNLQKGWTKVYKEKFLGRPDEYVVSNIRLVRDKKDYNNIIAVIVTDVSEKHLYDIISKLKHTDGKVQIIDDNGDIITTMERDKIGENINFTTDQLTVVSRQKIGSFRAILDDTDNYVVFSSIPDTNWHVIITTPISKAISSSLIKTTIIGVTLIFIVIILVIVALTLVFTIVANDMVKKVRDIARQIQKEGMDSLPSLVGKDKYLDKIKNHIIDLTTTIKRLDKEAYDAKIKERDYKLKALQAQINPHFLYNTLDAINWMAMRRKAMDISNMVTSLAKYFRLTLNKGKDIVSIRDEAELINTYVAIQKTRFEGIINWNCEIDDNILDYKIPKLTLQPLLENAFLHGIHTGEGKIGNISVRGYKKDEEIYIIISDNGVGMTKEAIDKILTEKDDTRSGYGIYNVNERLKLQYGEKYGLRIYSNPGEGTSVTVYIPAQN